MNRFAALAVAGLLLHACALNLQIQPTQGQSQAELEEDVKSCTPTDTSIAEGAGHTALLTLGAASVGASAGLLSDAGFLSWWTDAGKGTWIGATVGAFLGLTVGSVVVAKKYFEERSATQRMATECLGGKGYSVTP